MGVAGRLAVVLFVLALAGGAARAGDVQLLGQDLRYDVTESLLVEAHDETLCLHLAAPHASLCDSGDYATARYQDVFNRLDMDVASGAWLAAVRVDSADFFDTPGPRTIAENPVFYERYVDDARPEKVSVTYSGRHLELTLGDAYVQFGNGIALSLRKIDELAQDNTLRGIKAVVHEGPVDATAVAGWTNTANVDQGSGRFADDPDDFLYGARVEDRLGPVVLGAHGVGSVLRLDPGGGSCTGGAYAPLPLTGDAGRCNRTYTAGATLAVPYTPFGASLNAELDLRREDRSALIEDGWAGYLAASETRGALTALLEVKDYHNLDPNSFLSSVPSGQVELQTSYFTPPTLERPLAAEIVDEQDVWGPHLRLDYSLSPSALVYASGAWFTSSGPLGNVPPHGPEHHIVDPYAGTQLFWSAGESHAFLSGGVRVDQFASDGAVYNRDVHGEYDLVQVLRLPWSLMVVGDHHEREQLLAGSVPQGWREGDVALSLVHSPQWIASLGYEYTTQGLAVAPGLQTPSYPVKSLPNAAFLWNVTPRSSVRLFVGGSRGGLRCYNVCRVYPPFLGAKLEAVVRL